MKHTFNWLWNNSERISHWATALAFIAALIAGYLAYGQLKIANAQLEQANDQRSWQNYDEMNMRYAEIYKGIPAKIASGCTPISFDKLDAGTKRWVRQYFDLYSEEYWLYVNHLIPSEMWERRIHGGVRVNLSKYPALIDGYNYWKESGSFSHPDDFRSVVEKAIYDSKQAPYTKSRACTI